MKKKQFNFFVTTLLSVFVMIILAIPSAQAQFSIGLKVAGNAANYKKLTERDFGAEAGIFMRFGSGFFFQPEVNYSFKRSNLLDNMDMYSENEVVKQHFVAVPVLLGYHFINKDNFKFRLTLGPRFDFKIADNTGNAEWTSNPVQWGGQVGVGIDFWRFALDFSYCIAADNFRNMTEGTSQARQLNMFILSLGFKFIK